jgi:hypothetical protein
MWMYGLQILGVSLLLVLTLSNTVFLQKLIVSELVKFPPLIKPKVHYHFHKTPSVAPILSQINPVHALPPTLIKICFSIILPFAPRSSKRSSSFKVAH